ncbi:MAG: response regulator [Patescibacteria group bacterium]
MVFEKENLPDLNPEQLAAKIQAAYASLDYPMEVSPNEVPEKFEGFEPLRDRKVVMVDDGKFILTAFVPELMVATNGNAEFIEQSEQDAQQLTDNILSRNPEIVLMDYSLKSMTGSTVAKMLTEKKFQGIIIGFSNNSDSNSEFQKAGVTKTAFKSISNPRDSVLEVANLIGAKN